MSVGSSSTSAFFLLLVEKKAGHVLDASGNADNCSLCLSTLGLCCKACMSFILLLVIERRCIGSPVSLALLFNVFYQTLDEEKDIKRSCQLHLKKKRLKAFISTSASSISTVVSTNLFPFTCTTLPLLSSNHDTFYLAMASLTHSTHDLSRTLHSLPSPSSNSPIFLILHNKQHPSS